MNYVYNWEQFNESSNSYKSTSWTIDMDGEEVTVKIKEIEDFLNDSKIINIPVSKISNMCIHKDKTDKKTKSRVAKSDLSFPIIIAKGKNGKYSMILDGHHRLLKAINTNQKTIKAKVLNLKSAPKVYQKMFS